MESFDSSPNYVRATSSFDAKKENSPQGGSECDDIISVSSSTCGSATNGPYVPQLNNNGIKYRTNNKKTVKNFGSVRSFRRRAKSRVIQSPVTVSDEDSLVDSSEASPNYLKATSCSKGKKTHSQASPRHSGSPFDSRDKNSSHSSQPKLASPSHKSLQTLSRTSSLRNVRILIKKTSFKPKRSSVNYSKVSEDVVVDRATYSSTLKDSKFPEPVELHPGGTESEKNSALKVCRYHHCSLHGHCHGTHDAVPQPKSFLYKRRRSLKKQKSMIPKSDSSPGAKHSSDKKKNLQKSQVIPIVEPLKQEQISDIITFSGVEDKNGVDSYAEIYPKQEAQPFGDGYDNIQESDLIEVAFGETSFPERSYQENLNILRKYSLLEQEFGGTSFGLNGYCLRCSCHSREQVTSTPGRADVDLSLHKVTSSSLNGLKNEIPQNGFADVLSTSSPVLLKKPKEQVSTNIEDSATLSCANEASNKDLPETPVIFDEVTKKNSVFSSASYSQTSSDSNSEEGEFTTESTLAGDSKVNKVMQVKDSETNSPTHEGGKLQFSKQRHISMWHLIHQHMSSNLAAEPTSKPLQGADGESPVDGANSILAKESTTSCRDLSDSDMGTINNDSEIQEIELRKLFAIKLVREAIEKILLPEVQDQTSDDQSITSESSPRAELMEKNQSEASTQENFAEYDADKGEGNVSSNPKEESPISDDASGPEIKKNEKEVVKKSEKKAPKHWSNLKKWILLQRFIRELEKVRKFNPRKPQHLSLNPDPDAEKVNLRPQTVDERKSAEEWMLDYALRQAVGQLAPTQKRKVALLVKAFETVVPPQEGPQVQFRIPRLKDNGLDVSSTSYKVDESSEGHGRNKEEELVNGKAVLTGNDRVSILDSANQETGIKMTKKTEKLYDLNENYGESSVKFLSSTDERIGELTSTEKSVFSSTICTSLDDLPASKEEIPRETSGDHLDLQGIQKDTNFSLKSEYFDDDIVPTNGNIKPEDPDSENGEPSSTTQSLILGGNEKSVATESTLGPAFYSDAVKLEKIMADETEREAMPTLQGLREDAISDCVEGKTKDSGRCIRMDRKNHIKMWHMIYQHVVSGIAEKVGSQLLDGAEDDEVEDNMSPAINNGDGSNDFSQPTDDSSEKNNVSSNLSIGFTKSDALKLVKEAVDEILLPEIQDDSSDTQSVTSESISEQDISERNFSEIGGQNISSEGGILLDEEGKSSRHDIISTQEDAKAESQVSKKSELLKPKNWSKLKKLILLKRSIKALEKARNLKPQPHQLIPQTPDPEPEKIDLRRQMVDERKKAEQWMLDYAVQHIVTKLTPARKRRVSMLVEAFEAVVPLPEM
ncbi:hypothetical protein Pfo_028379 [Paulownia fortunei]|nr:hypothetical protein Pfo_028379 [Paulownia fortunei]